LFSKNVSIQVKEDIKRIFPAPDIDGSFVHLGHPLILPSKEISASYNFVYDIFKSKLSSYKANRLSHAERLTLIKFVFSSIPVYYMSNILFSKKFFSKLMVIIRNFWWTCGQVFRMIKPLEACALEHGLMFVLQKNIGGLGVRNLQAVNQGLILSGGLETSKGATKPDRSNSKG
jgi:hypothetical protein